MSDMPAGTRAPDRAESKAQQVAGQTGDAAGRAASDVKDTARGQAKRVGDEASAQAHHVAAEVRGKVNEQAHTQNDKLVSGIRRMADELEQMRGERQDSPAATVVSRVADGGRQMADYLDRNGPEGVLREVQDFARRRPGAFLATALVSGFVVGRLGKGVVQADRSAGTGGKPDSDTFVSATPGSTSYRSESAYVDSGYPASAVGDPGYVDPNYVDPNYVDPNYVDPGYVERDRGGRQQ